MAAILKIVFGDTSAVTSVKFCAGKQNSMARSRDIENSTWRAAAILQIVKSPYLNEKSSNFEEIWCSTAHLKLDDS